MSADTASLGVEEVDTYQLAAELNVDARLLRQFVDEHPRPTAPIVLGWAFRHGELSAPPAQLRADVEAWLSAILGQA